ncbi:double-strand break repair helicase AddA [Novosphingobium album (ex Liu et al. 2023)]|uniref:DNA 3'-5' helicase n=1 Tax=Novosphingobium album (ex Liu et al. 2023) TaxID=3031130 RepID=A0ABT5WRB9_9SPHN|nr:double-strand break repair helicase AddA [Novosphingobium album (ex Liu et al. 2023)]MDE8652576.1 double-strand break repair helicase AddA [Novosphingobium album (ex Liu et al. 2023)]
MSGGGTVHPLRGNQMAAVHPEETVWLSASAGTGKTQVLSSRVLRLLLQPGVEPSQILCLTFTKAGATEMAARISGTLAEWVRLPDAQLFQRLEAIGAPADPVSRNRARTLFAAVLDCPGGGLRIDTIHAFSQWLLAAFPREAGLIPGTRPMEDRERVLLARQVLADLLVEAESDPLGDPQLLAAVEDLSLRMGPDAVEAYLLRCAEAREAWFGAGSWQAGDMRRNLMRLLGLPADADAGYLAGLCEEAAFDVASLRRCLAAQRGWSAKTGQQAAEAIAAWLAGDGAHRAATLAGLRDVFLTKKGDPRATTSLEKIDPDYPDYATRVIAGIGRVAEAGALLGLADRLVPALRLGRAFALAWEAAKQREGLIDFDDQIRQAAALLGQSALADWIRYKLDRRFDHILVDEAQDTNAAQWDIILAIAEEFWAGLGQHGDLMRTLFVVGDYKQAIFRFQGTSPEYFRQAGERVKQLVHAGKANVERLRSNIRPRALRELGLDQSFRTAGEVLAFVDRAIAAIGHANFGLDAPPEPHVGQDRPGHVALWQPVGMASEEDGDEPDEGEEGWLSKPDRQLAERIARQVSQWTDPSGPGFRLHKGEARRAGPGDVMVLVRKRKELAGLIVARLHAAGVPVAGVDRLRLGAPLAVKDLVAALRFAAQPLDDLNLANLLVSPLVGWSQEQLLEHAWRPRDTRLWEHLRQSRHGDVHALRDRLGELLRLADVEPPQALLHWLLVGPWQGRRRLVARLGVEANDPIDELLNAAHAYVATGTASLAGFLAWFDAGEGELKREAENAGNLVRVMTVHGSKGLQAPIVILADATGDPGNARDRGIALPDPADPGRRIPLPALAKEEKVGRIAAEAARIAREEEQEHWRLLYVAMTRAEEALFVGGALGPRDKGEVPESSWYARLATLFPADAWVPDAIWSRRLDWGTPPEPMRAPSAAEPVLLQLAHPQLALPEPLPRWLATAPAAEPRPPRPLAPSALGEDDAPDPPWPPGSDAAAARRGTLMHRLLERMPEVEGGAREAAGRAWLARNAADFAEAAREDMLAGALAVIGHPDWADLFAPGSLAEVPIAAVVGERVVAGTIDRLVVAADRVRLVDFKTARRPPASIGEVPRASLRQMAAYAAALAATYPGRAIEVALLYTAAPRLIAVPADVLAAHKPDLAPMQ